MIHAYHGEDLPQGTIVLLFVREGCQACRAMRKSIGWLASAREVYVADMNKFPDLYDAHEVDMIPAFLLLQDGHLVARSEGPCSFVELARRLGIGHQEVTR